MAEAAHDQSAILDLVNHPALIRLRVPAVAPAARPLWCRAELAGRLCELNAGPDSAQLTAAFALVLDTQREGEAAAWITAAADTFFPPDAAAGGVELAALPVVRTRDTTAAGRAADLLLRSGAFGLVVVELGVRAVLPAALQGRLVQLARKHDAAVLCLTDRPAAAPALGSLVSLRAVATRWRASDAAGGELGGSSRDHPRTGGRFVCEIDIVKDKRRGPGWSWREVCRGPEGLR